MIINDAYFHKKSIYKFNMMQTDLKILIFRHFWHTEIILVSNTPPLQLMRIQKLVKIG